MWFSPILLVKAGSLEEAKELAENFCDNECGDHSYFDYGCIVKDEVTEWNKPIAEVWDKLPPDTHVKDAQRFLKLAEEKMVLKMNEQAGYYYGKAGKLLSEDFCVECPLFNIEYYNYSRENAEGWFVIETDFHF
jgi:hypothetical protein